MMKAETAVLLRTISGMCPRDGGMDAAVNRLSADGKNRQGWRFLTHLARFLLSLSLSLSLIYSPDPFFHVLKKKFALFSGMEFCLRQNSGANRQRRFARLPSSFPKKIY
ncbi:MAG: hypothetical protein LBJ24_07165, partial [Treponema sp.]|nr:hypothetical protein [Treponema sp.]